MPSPFVWFDNIGSARADTTKFLKNAFGWADQDIGPMTFLTAGGQEKPFAATTDTMKDVTGWVPYLEVDDLASATAEACKHGAAIIAENLKGPPPLSAIPEAHRLRFGNARRGCRGL